MSFAVSFVLVGGVLLVIALSSTANASTYSLTTNGNWTTSANWSCTGTGAPGSTGCVGGFPGGGGVDGDIANIGGSTVTVNAGVPNAVTLNLTGLGSMSVSGGGLLNLIGASSVTSSGGFFSINGGTLNNNGTFNLGGFAGKSLDGGTLGGTGTTTVGGTFSVTGSSGPMTIGAGQTISNAGTINFSSSANPLTLNGSIANGSTFNISGTAPINGTGSIANTGTFSTTSTSTIGVTFDNSGAVNEGVSGAKLSFTGGGTHTGTFNTGGTGGGFDFNGTHTFNAGSGFTGGPVQNLSGGSWIVNSALSISGAFSNGGALSFAGAPQTLSASSFTQPGTGSFSPRLVANGSNDSLAISPGTATLGGTLSPSLLYSPANGDGFVVLTSSADSGTMSYTPVTYSGGQINATFGATSVSLAAVATADLTLTKTASPTTISTGQNTTFTVTVSNSAASSPATSVVVTDNLSGGTFVSATPSQGTCSGTAPITCSLGTLNPGTAATIAIVVTGSSPGSILNDASVTAAEPDPNPSDNSVTGVTVTVNPSADLGLTITDVPDPVNAGGTVVYTAQVTNGGPDPADVTVNFTLAGGTITGATSAGLFGCTFTATTAQCIYSGSLPPAGTDTITINTTAGTGASMSLTGVATSTVGDPAGGNNTATQATAIIATADLAITKSGPPNWIAGQNNFYTITVTNNGPSAATSVTVSDPTPANMTFVSNTGACTTTFPCTIPSLASGASVTITSTYQLAPSATGTVSNTATVSTTSATDPAPSNNSSTATSSIVSSTDFEVIKTGPASAAPASTISYSIQVKNLGPSDATSPITVSDTASAGLTLVSVSGGGCTAFPCPVGPLAAGSFVTITATYTVTATSGSVTNTASVPLVAGDPVSTNNASTATTTITPQADLQVTKSGPTEIPSSGNITFVITVKNNGPSDAFTVTLADPTPSGTSFLSASAPCSTGFPCSLSSIPSGSTVTVSATYAVGFNVTTVTNTASVSSSTADPVSANNSSSVTVTGTICPDVPTQVTPLPNSNSVPVAGVLQWTDVGATSYEVYFGPAGSGCNSLMGTVAGTSFSYSGLTAGTTYESRIVALKSGCDPQPSSCVSWKTAGTSCTLQPATLLEPLANTTVGSPITFRWQAVTGADKYHVFASVNGGAFNDLGETADTFLTASLPNGPVTWYVTASGKDCAGSTSARSTFNACTAPEAPLISVVGAPTSGQQYTVSWEPVVGAVSYKLDEATNDSFRDAVTQTIDGLSAQFTHATTTGALTYFYRVRAVGTCAAEGAFSRVVRVVVLPPPANVKYPNFDIPAGARNPVTLDVFIEGDPSGPQNFVINLDKPWMLSVTPSSGVLPPAGITVKLTVDPSQLPNGSVTGTLLVTLTPVGANSSGRESNASTPRPVPVTVNLVTPVTPTSVAGPNADTIIIPAVGRLTGVNSQWRSDVRIFNGAGQSLKYQLDFVPSQANESKRTTVTTAAGDTTALDDIIHNWYGFGEVGDNASGVLQIQALTTTGSKPPSSSLATVVSSRTYNNTASNGTLGQYIPGLLFSQFIGKPGEVGKPGAVLSLQQLAQTASYRTNVGVLEASGKPATVLLSVLNTAGQKLVQDFAIQLKGGEQLALNQLLSQKGITASDARIEVRVTGGDGKVSAYASVVDNTSQDPLLVSPVLLGQTTAQRYVLPGVAEVNTGSALWRTDLRILNGGSAVQTLNLLFYPQGNAGSPLAAALTVNPGETKVLDNVLSTLFSASNTGGAVHVNTAVSSQLVVTGRTYNQTGSGTLGQFIPAATLTEGIGAGGRGLNILQVEDSVRYRTNIGLAEMSGNAATVEVSVHLPDSKVTPTIKVPLAANEFTQFALSSLGLQNIYNARVSISVTGGTGKVTAYGSVIDMLTTDPTYVPAQ